MPYFVYKIVPFPFKQLELVQRFDKFPEASAFAKARRAEMTPQDNYSIKVIFAENELKAEDLLNQEREPEPMVGDDY